MDFMRDCGRAGVKDVLEREIVMLRQEIFYLPTLEKCRLLEADKCGIERMPSVDAVFAAPPTFAPQHLA